MAVQNLKLKKKKWMKNMMTKSQKKIGKVMGEYKEGSLKMRSGQKVKSRDQALAIAMSEAGKKMRVKK